jgi:hypothetical protein
MDVSTHERMAVAVVWVCFYDLAIQLSIIQNECDLLCPETSSSVTSVLAAFDRSLLLPTYFVNNAKPRCPAVCYARHWARTPPPPRLPDTPLTYE